MVILNPGTGELTGDGVVEIVRCMADLNGVFFDADAYNAKEPSEIVYRVQSWEPKPEGIAGAVCAATTFLYPGMVGEEYHMTRGHYHANMDCPELETVISGTGYLVLMDRNRQTRTEFMFPGSVHHVPPGTAHRVANTGPGQLVFVSYWASETGHDYQAIHEFGFGARLLNVNNEAVLVHS